VVCSRMRKGQYHSRYLGLKRVNIECKKGTGSKYCASHIICLLGFVKNCPS